MSHMIMCPENFPLIMAHEPVLSDAINDGSNAVCLKGAAGCLIVVLENQVGGTTDLKISVHQGATAAIAEAGTYEMATLFPIWYNLTPLVTDVMTRASDAATYTIDAAAQTHAIVAIYVSASQLTATYDWISAGSSLGDGANYATIMYILDKARYKPSPALTT